MSSQEEESFWAVARRLATIEARRQGLEGDRLQECVQGFVVRFLLVTRNRLVPVWKEAHFSGFLQRSILNYVANFLRTLAQQQRWASGWFGMLAYETAEEDSAGVEFLDPACSPQARLFRGLFWEEIAEALFHLSLEQRTLLVQYHLEGCRVEELAIVWGCGEEAIKKRLSRARQKLRSVLIQQGNTEAELRSYVQEWLAAGPVAVVYQEVKTAADEKK